MRLPESFSKCLRSPIKWRGWLIVGIGLVAAHALSVCHYAARYENGDVHYGPPSLTLDMTPDDWSKILAGRDADSYLRVGENIAAGRGVVISDPASRTPHYGRFTYWAPGAPFAFGVWLKLFGGRTMWSLFWFSAVIQLIFGILVLATAAIWTRSPLALLLIAISTGFCPPLQNWFYSENLTSSEIISLVPLALFVLVFARAMIAYHQAEGTFWGMARQWRVAIWFILAGMLIGVNSLVRDSATILGTFTAAFVFGRSLLMDRRRLALAACSAAMVMLGVAMAREPVKHWNNDRAGISVVSTGVTWGLWRLSLWQPHDKFGWYTVTGVGLGEYLDPHAAARVDKYFNEKQPHPEWYSFKEFVHAVSMRPLDAIAFKAVRLPVLWLGTTDRWPNIVWGLTPIWCAAFYGMFALFCLIQWRRGRRVPEVLYLSLLMIACASVIVHYEFRYTFPVWNTLVMAPGLVVAVLSKNGWRSEIDLQKHTPLAEGEPALDRAPRLAA